MSEFVRPDPRSFGGRGAGAVIGPMCLFEGARAMFLGRDIRVLYGARWTVAPGAAGARIRVGDGTRVGRYSRLLCRLGIDIGRDVLTADHVFIGDHQPGAVGARLPAGEVSVGDGAFLGWGVVLTPGVSVGAGAYVGAGAVVMNDVPPRAVAVGNPARLVSAYDAASDAWVRT